MQKKRFIEDLGDIRGKRVLVRVDFNVPIKDGQITDYTRIDAALPTIRRLTDEGARVILCSHLGRPKGNPDPAFTLAPVAEALADRLPGTRVVFADDPAVVSDAVKKTAQELEDGDVMLLQNTRYRKEEEKYGKEPEAEKFAEELASLCDGIFVEDAFGSVHRAHCSTVGAAKLCSDAVAGYLVEKELRFLGQAVDDPKRPFAAILGGAKVSDKLKVINNLLEKVDILIIGGGMAYTFLKAQGHAIGKSLCEDDQMEYTLEMVAKAKEKGVKLLLPVDSVAGAAFAADTETITAEEIPADYMGMDIGPKTMALYAEALKEAKTVIWNGPMGVFEFEKFQAGTKCICEVLAGLEDAVTIIGGGDSASAVGQFGFADKMTHISTGGGASLEFLEGIDLPGIAILQDDCGCCGGRRILAAGNWKMNKTPSEAVKLCQELIPLVKSEETDVLFCVPAIDIPAVVEAVKGTNIAVGAEDMSFEESGAFTGQISAAMLKDAGCSYVILGHSERREYNHETSEEINKKMIKALEHGLIPIMCCGETLAQREQGITLDWIRQQVKVGFQNIPAEQAAGCVIAYEPIWAIGTGKTATSEQAEEVCGAIRTCICEIYGEATAAKIRILYGGSVNAGNAAELFAMPDIDGGLVGGASLKPDFGKIVNYK